MSNDQGCDPVLRYRSVRSLSDTLTEALTPEDQQVQSMPDVSPTKWHRAHTTWFFETFILTPSASGYVAFDAMFGYLFNSYYESVGPRQPRLERGLLTRPSCDDITRYRRHVDRAMLDTLESGVGADAVDSGLFELGLHHEQQHQELMLMDIKHVFSVNPTRPAYRPEMATRRRDVAGTEDGVDTAGWACFDGGTVEIGHGGPGFAFDNETPRHRVHLEPYRLADRLVTNLEWLAFMEDAGYQRPELWLSDGWAILQAGSPQAPLYWVERDAQWMQHTLSGLRPLDPREPVCHVSFYEADAFARWAGARLPTEAEWEHAAEGATVEGNLLASGRLHPHPAPSHRFADGLRQLFGDVWEWTASPYVTYPRFRPAVGAVGEYNAKFASNQMVLRGGCCVTPPGHLRATYRNFFPPHARWPFAGLRLAADGDA